jgi:hypothetical protein
MFGRNRIKLDPALYERAVRRAEALGYSSVDEYVTVLVERDQAAGEGAEGDDELLDRLKGLGYLD